MTGTASYTTWISRQMVLGNQIDPGSFGPLVVALERLATEDPDHCAALVEAAWAQPQLYGPLIRSNSSVLMPMLARTAQRFGEAFLETRRASLSTPQHIQHRILQKLGFHPVTEGGRVSFQDASGRLLKVMIEPAAQGRVTGKIVQIVSSLGDSQARVPLREIEDVMKAMPQIESMTILFLEPGYSGQDEFCYRRTPDNQILLADESSSTWGTRSRGVFTELVPFFTSLGLTPEPKATLFGLMCKDQNGNTYHAILQGDQLQLMSLFDEREGAPLITELHIKQRLEGTKIPMVSTPRNPVKRPLASVAYEDPDHAGRGWTIKLSPAVFSIKRPDLLAVRSVDHTGQRSSLLSGTRRFSALHPAYSGVGFRMPSGQPRVPIGYL